MAQLLLLRGARQVLTLRGDPGARRGPALQDLGIVEDGSVLVRDGVIAAVGTTRRLENLKEARSAIEIPVSSSIVMPGFIDPSFHISLLEDPGSISPRKRKNMGDFYTESLNLLRSCLQYGTLTLQARASAMGRKLHSDISVLRRLTAIGNNPVGMIRSWRIESLPEANALDDFEKTLFVMQDRAFAHAIDLTAPVAEAVKDSAAVTEVLPHARFNLALNGRSVPDLQTLLDRYRPACVFCPSNLDGGSAAIVSKTPAVAVFSPGYDLLNGNTGNALREMADAGAAIALSSGYHPRRAPTFSMQAVSTLAVLWQELSPEEAISASTINAAHALGVHHTTGSLEVGKRADVLIVNVPDYREIPRRFGINHVVMVIREGNVVFNRTRWKVSGV